MATGIAHRLHRCHMKVVVTEAPVPTTVRRMVAFAEAVFKGDHVVEGVRAERVTRLEEVYRIWEGGGVPVFVDPSADLRENLRPQVVIDAIMAKRCTGTALSMAPLVVGVGPGFRAGENVHAVVETNRGHNLGRVIWQGEAEEDTGEPAPVGGYTHERVLRVPKSGIFEALHEIGDMVDPEEVVARVHGIPIRAQIKGVLRGLLKRGIEVEVGMKAGDIDPRGKTEICFQISDKARAIAGGVLEAILHALLRDGGNNPFSLLKS